MSRLKLIVGPPNSGKAGHILERLAAALGRDPVLVVPTLDDADRFERELATAATGQAVLGASILTFRRLFEEVARAAGVVLPPALGESQALYVARRAVADAPLRVLRRSARRPGFAPALVALIDEIQAAGLDPATVAANAADSESDRPYLEELAALYGTYVSIRDRLGLGDGHLAAARATAALRAEPASWGERPILFYGFDDLTNEQLELVAALARATDVTFAVAYEDRRALAARATLLARLVEIGGEEGPRLEPDATNTESPALFHLERWFLRDHAPRVDPDDGLVLLEAAGERGQAEQIGAAVARLIADGAAADEIAIVVRTPNREGPLYESVLSRFGIPVATEARVPLARTATGRGLLALLRASMPAGTADDLLTFVRAPDVAREGDGDWLERRIRRRRLRTAAEALEAWNGRELFEIEALADAGTAAALLAELARFARRIAERPLQGAAVVASSERRLELRAGAAAAAALEELAALPEIADPAAEALAALEALEVPLWRGPTEGHVLVTSPYRIRARRVEHLFVASLQEGEFPRHDAGEPFLSDELRAAVRMPPRADPDDEERYLFGTCLSRPTRRLFLCWRSCDDEGADASPSPFLEDVRDLIAPAPIAGEADLAFDERVRRRDLAEVVLPVSAAPSLDELARALAAANGSRDDPSELPGITPEQGRSLAERLADAVGRSERNEPGPLHEPMVLAALGERELFGASTLEEYELCSYRWFVGHELDPQPLEPLPDALLQGSVIHAVLEALYADPPAPGALPRSETVAAWQARAAELVAARADDARLGGDDARAAMARARMLALIEGLLAREALLPDTIRPDPELLEAAFGEQDDADRPPLDLDGVKLHGKIDRVDVVGSGGGGLVRDYKVSRTVTKGNRLADEGKLQLQLYAVALERLWNRPPLGGVYMPLAGTGDHTPRGIALRDEADGALAGLGLMSTDLLDRERFDTAIDAAIATAQRIAGQMRSGRIDRDPIDDRCPRFCTFQSICRRDRTARLEPERDLVEEEEE